MLDFRKDALSSTVLIVSKNKIQTKRLEKKPFRNLFEIIREGKFIELPKIFRRRVLNTSKFVKRGLRKVIGSVLNMPALQKSRDKKKLHKTLMQVFHFDNSKGYSYRTSINVAIIVHDGFTHPKSSAFIRLIAPLTHSTIRNKISIRLYQDNTTRIDPNTDICIVQRTAYQTAAQAQLLINNLRNIESSLVIDTDDAFNSIDETHPEFEIHRQRSGPTNLLLESASQIWVSTPMLKKSFSNNLQAKIIVINNGLDKRIWKYNPKNSRFKLDVRKRLELVYMGSATHDSDLQIIIPALESLYAKYPQTFRLTLIGITDSVPDRSWIRRIYLKSSLYPDFVGWFVSKKRFDIGLSPLIDSDFNRSKSDIKCLDYIAAGILPIVSNVSAYKSPVLDDFIVRTNNTVDDWEKTLGQYVTGKVDREEIEEKIRKGQKYLWEKRSSKNTATKIINQLKLLA